MSEESTHCLVNVKLSNLKTAVYSLTHAEPFRLRFLDCRRLWKNDVVYISEYKDLPKSYAAASYVWRGLLPTQQGDSFYVKGVEKDVDNKNHPISFDVLRIICQVACSSGLDLLWLDKLSIRQDKSEAGSEDQAWHVERMHSIYKNCKTCFVLPGGLVRLAGLDEGTSWTDRAWTLQEA